MIRPPTLLALPSYLAGNVARLGNAPLVFLLKDRGLSLAQFSVLVALSDFGPLAPHDLAARLQTDRSHVSSHVEVLLRRGWVERVDDDTDRRRVTVTLTTAGGNISGDLITAAIASQEHFLDVLSVDDQLTLRSLLTKVLTAATPAAH